jgi:cytochrome b6-f complex iron-sulfur subunit
MIAALAIAGGVVLVVILLLAMSRRQDRETAIGVLSRETRKRDRSDAALGPIAESAPPPVTARDVERSVALERAGRSTAVVVAEPPPPPAPVIRPPMDDEALGVTRRQFLNRSILGMFGLAVAGFGASVLAFLWKPTTGGGFGSKIFAGKVSDINDKIQSTKAPFYVPQARTYINPYPVGDVPKAKKSGAYADPILAGMQNGFVALYQKCVHLGCRVPWCQSSQWFECPCHGSQYNRVGEKKGGPAPRGLDRFALLVDDSGGVSIDTSQVFLGPPIGTNTTGQEAEGPHCR